MKTQAATPALVKWLGYIAIVLLLALPVSVILVRSGVLAGLTLFGLACLGAALALALTVVLLLLPRLAAWRGKLLLAALALLPGSVLIGVLFAGGGNAPAIHNISTDLQDPPEFVNAPTLRGANANPLAIDPKVMEIQRTAFPDLGTLESSLSPAEAWDRALDVAADLDWEVVYQAPDQTAFEAVATTAIMGFKDDVAVRLRPQSSGGTDIDLHSVSRVGMGDMGANAARIRAFGQQFQR